MSFTYLILAALRAFVALRDASGKPLVWDDPLQGGVGLRDSFNLDSGRAFDGGVAIDAGPMLLAIENARTGLIWELFSQHPMGERMISRLGWRRR